MADLRLKQIVVALCLMATLLLGSVSACTCSHHEETKAAEADCHLNHETSMAVERSVENNTIDVDCVCFVKQPSPYVTSKTEGKELKAADAVLDTKIVVVTEFVAATAFNLASPEFAGSLSYSYTLKSLLPARAPPRL